MMLAGNTPSSQFNQAYTIYMVNGLQFNYRMLGQHPIITIQPSIYHLHGQWPSIQLTGWWGNTPSSQFNQAYTIYMVNGFNSKTDRMVAGNTPSSQFNQAYTIYMVNGLQFNYRMLGQHPIITIQQAYTIYMVNGIQCKYVVGGHKLSSGHTNIEISFSKNTSMLLGGHKLPQDIQTLKIISKLSSSLSAGNEAPPSILLAGKAPPRHTNMLKFQV